MSAPRVAARKTHRAVKQQVNLCEAAKALSSLMFLLKSPTDPDDRLCDRGQALIRLWAEPFTAFVSSLVADRGKQYDASRNAFKKELEEIKGSITAILEQQKVAAPQRLKQVAQQIVRVHAVHPISSLL